MKVKDLIHLLSEQDPESDLFIQGTYNKGFFRLYNEVTTVAKAHNNTVTLILNGSYESIR